MSTSRKGWLWKGTQTAPPTRLGRGQTSETERFPAHQRSPFQCLVSPGRAGKDLLYKTPGSGKVGHPEPEGPRVRFPATQLLVLVLLPCAGPPDAFPKCSWTSPAAPKHFSMDTHLKKALHFPSRASLCGSSRDREAEPNTRSKVFKPRHTSSNPSCQFHKPLKIVRDPLVGHKPTTAGLVFPAFLFRVGKNSKPPNQS